MLGPGLHAATPGEREREREREREKEGGRGGGGGSGGGGTVWESVAVDKEKETEAFTRVPLKKFIITNRPLKKVDCTHIPPF